MIIFSGDLNFTDCTTHLQYSHEKHFFAILNSFCFSSRYFADGDTRIKKIFEKFDPLQTGYIDYITWSMMLQPQVR